MNPVFARVRDHFDQHNFKYQTDEEHDIIHATLASETGVYRMLGRAEENLLQFWAQAPLRVPEGARPMVSEAVNRINYGMKLGCFEMDLTDGELRFHAASLVDDSLSDLTIGRLVVTTIAMMDRYMPAIHSVIYGNELPSDAVRLAEMS